MLPDNSYKRSVLEVFGLSYLELFYFLFGSVKQQQNAHSTFQQSVDMAQKEFSSV